MRRLLDVAGLDPPCIVQSDLVVLGVYSETGSLPLHTTAVTTFGDQLAAAELPEGWTRLAIARRDLA